MMDNDRAPSIAWTIIRVVVYVARFWIGAFCLLAGIGAIISIFGSYRPAVAAWHALILVLLAFFIWPQRYNPPLRFAARIARKKLGLFTA